ncbi:CAP domain-containing protein [Sphingomonas aracearum]|uniref:CAP domain-containing protein n=1 Tax=Sphingomonas aracearum TaxID=2283317 RepID=A0A369W060_9SPHN|nr:CAP domain-containing protein [Sphingomonas aracearum]
MGTPTPAPAGFSAQVAALYDVAPDPANCRAGTLKASVKADALARLNAIRALHNLSPVTYSDAEDAQEAESSLMQAVNRTLSHTPPTSWTCYSPAGAAAAGASNLIGGWGNGLGYSTEDDYMATWLNEGGSASIGHRRWLLSPFLGKISYGRVAYQSASGDRVSTASLRVFNFAAAPPLPGSVPSFVAYPFNDYPQRYFRPGDYLSFSAVPYGGGSFGANANVSFARATITVTGPSGALPVTDVSYDNGGYGVANSVQWRVTGLALGTSYTVRISGVTGTAQAEYSYTFRIS